MFRSIRSALVCLSLTGTALVGCVAETSELEKLEGDADPEVFDGPEDSLLRPTAMGRIEDGATERGTFGRDARYLAWVFDATAGDEIEIVTDAVSPRYLDTVVSVYRTTAALRPTGRALASNDDCDPYTLNSCITFTASFTGTHVLVVRRYNRGTSGSFTVSLDITSATIACGSRGLGPCPDGMFCSWGAGANCGRSDHPGVCAVRPDACITLYDPVCGCDGSTYSNSCAAASAGVSVELDGACPTGCDPMDAVGEGMCRRLPFGWAWGGSSCRLVQGCECIGADCGALYATIEECVADRSACDYHCGGLLGITCPDGLYCNYAPETMCGSGDQMGSCETPPTVCTREVRPVCGCDGATYSNACNAAAAGASVLHDGPC